MGIFSRKFPSDNFEQKGWKVLDSLSGIDEILSLSFQKPVIIFKHSITCGISAHVKEMLFSAWDIDPEHAALFYLDLITYRPVSNEVAARLGIVHQSPQAIVIKNGKAVGHASHFDVTADMIKSVI